MKTALRRKARSGGQRSTEMMGSRRGFALMGMLGLVACVPEDYSRITIWEDPCGVVRGSLASIGGAADAQIAFECLNSQGQLDPLEPLVTALATSPAPHGGSLLDAWLLRDSTSASPDLEVLASQAEGLAAALETGGVGASLNMTAQAIDEGVVPGLVKLAGSIAGAIEAAQPEGRQAFYAALGDLMCHGGVGPELCQSPLRRYLQGVGIERIEREPTDEGFAFLSDESMRARADWMLYAGGDVERARLANSGLARALVHAAQPRVADGGGPSPSLLEEVLGQTLPRLHGDDPSTPDHFEGYGSRNTTQSALYGLFLEAGRPEVRQAVVNAKPESLRLLTSYYPLDPLEVGGSARDSGQCLTADPSELHGVGQLLRLLDAAAYDFDDPRLPAQCGLMMEAAVPFLSTVYDLSNSHNLAVLTLEVFSQMPPDQAQQGANLLNHVWSIGAVEAMCDLGIVVDDTEVVQTVTYMPANMGYSQPYLRAISAGGQLERVLLTLRGVYRTGVWCDLTETLRLFDDPRSFSAPVRDVEPLFPQPGGDLPAHDRVTVPRMDMLADIGNHAGALLPPLEAALRQPGVEGALTDILMGLGQLAHRPDSALLQGHTMEVATALKDPTASRVARWERAVADPALMELVMATLADDQVRAALVDTGPTGLSLLQEIAARLSSQTLDDELRALGASLRQLSQTL